MGRRSGRRPRPSRVRVRTQRRDEIDVDALARAVLEQTAMDEQSRREAQSSDVRSPGGRDKEQGTGGGPHD